VKTLLPILLLGLAGVLVGGSVSMRQQGAGRVPIIVLGLLAVIAAVAGVLWLVPES
jgi:hypothetical protein